MQKVEIPITFDNLPKGPRWEEDGSCWVAKIDEISSQGWAWVPLNNKAIAKQIPKGPMTDYHPAQFKDHEMLVKNKPYRILEDALIGFEFTPFSWGLSWEVCFAHRFLRVGPFSLTVQWPTRIKHP